MKPMDSIGVQKWPDMKKCFMKTTQWIKMFRRMTDVLMPSTQQWESWKRPVNIVFWASCLLWCCKGSIKSLTFWSWLQFQARIWVDWFLAAWRCIAGPRSPQMMQAMTTNPSKTPIVDVDFTTGEGQPPKRWSDNSSKLDNFYRCLCCFRLGLFGCGGFVVFYANTNSTDGPNATSIDS